MNHETFTDEQALEKHSTTQDSVLHETRNDPSPDTVRIAVAATFTADMLQAPLQFWMKQLETQATIVIAPYAQVIQELLDPQSTFATTKRGFNLMLVRLEDFIRDRMGEGIERNVRHLQRTAADLLMGVRATRKHTNAPLLVFLCPASSALPSAYRPAIAELERDLQAQSSAIAEVHFLSHAELMRLYPVERFEDAGADQVGHIPYSDEYFRALATLLARHIAARIKPRYKVIAFDCDNTLWKGICGEDGAAGIELTEAHLAFQKLLVRQHDAGMLLCACSRNNESDVQAVFKSRLEMPLREEHIVASQINWSAKSDNLLALARELDLSIDSFIFIDDSAIECAEVMAHCPTVLTLQLPADPAEIAHFLDHAWVFDQTAASTEAKQRTLYYKQNRARREARQDATDLHGFLASLELQIDVSPMQSEHLPRVAELTQRTNQFNLTTLRRTAGDIETLWSCDLQCLVVHVSDRFGDYGLVGAVFYKHGQSSLEVDTFLLSCRVLGRAVEHRVLNELGRIGRGLNVASVVLRCQMTARNAPARSFLDKYLGQFRENDEVPAEQWSYTVPVEYACTLGLRTEGVSESPPEPSPSSTVAGTRSSMRWHERAYRLSRLTELAKEIHSAAQKHDRGAAPYVAPRTPVEKAVAAIWAELLNVESVGIEDDFFQLGGDSLKAVQVISRVGSRCGLELKLEHFFGKPTVAAIAARLADAPASIGPLASVERGRAGRLSSAQLRLWFIDQLEGGSAAYHIPLAFRVRGALSKPALQASLDTLLARHEALRAVFTKADGEPVQHFPQESKFAMRIVDLSMHTAADREAELSRQSIEEVTAPFDLSCGPSIRGRLIRLSQDDHLLLITMHHIVSDGWSIGVLLRELGALYQSHQLGQPMPLAELPIQYADYAHWQRQWLESESSRRQLSYWKEHLSGIPELLNLPLQRPRPAVQTYRGERVRVAIGMELTREVKSLARECNVTLAMVLHAAWSIALSRLSGQQDIVIGVPVANRRRTEFEGLIGLFVNTLAVRVQMQDDPSAASLLMRVRGVLLDAYANQDVPFEHVVEALNPARNLSYSPIFQVMSVLQNTPRAPLQLAGLETHEEEVPSRAAKFDLVLELEECADGIAGSLEYATDLFESTTAQRFVGCFETILAAMAQQPTQKISRLPLLSDAQRRQVIEAFNATAAEYPSEKAIHEVFEARASQTPGRVAATYDDSSLTYSELNRRANQWAWYLRKRGVAIGDYVPVMMARSLDMLVAQLAILKAGAVYVPLDPELPAERKGFIIKDSGARLAIADANCNHASDQAVQWLDRATIAAAASNETTANLGLTMASRAPAYVMYTSGSTGVPKGVVVPHRAVNRLAINGGYAHITPEDCLAHYSNPAFDASTFEIWGALLNGARVVIIPQCAVLEAHRFGELLRQHDVTILYMSVGLFNRYTQALADVFKRLRYLMIGGDALEPQAIGRVLRSSPPQHLLNVYGPTECTTFATSHVISAVAANATNIPIGRPISNTQVYVLDDAQQPVPVGVIGEIYLGGAGVACGYLNREDLTAQRFVADPFSPEPHARMYRTGDVGRWLADGTVEYLGRNDRQVKIRGFRIEPAEIEAQLTRHEKISEAVVLARSESSGDKRLVAYVVSRDAAHPPAAEELRGQLKRTLPDYMIPSGVVLLDRMPLTSTGKIDRAALPVPHFGAYPTRAYESPQGESEQALAVLWQGLLHVDQVGRGDNFFELGGHSLLIVEMLDRLRSLGFVTEVRRVFENPVLADLASRLVRAPVGGIEIPANLIPPGCSEIIPQMLTLVNFQPEHIQRIVDCAPGGAGNIQDVYPLTALQEGILFHHLESRTGSDAYVLAGTLEFESRQRLDAFIEALQDAIDRHDTLRTAILWEQLPQPVQVVWRKAELHIQEVKLDAGVEARACLDDWIRPERQWLDLRQAPLVRLRVAAERCGSRWYGLLQLHHAVVDGRSLNAVMGEVVAQLEGRARPDRERVPYRNHVAQAVAYANSSKAAEFFRGKLGDVDEPTAPFGLLDVHGDGCQMVEAREALEPQLAERIRVRARHLNVTPATLFHAAWALVVAQAAVRDDIVFGSVLLGRLHGSAGASGTIGMFLNTLPMRLQLHGLSATELVGQTQRELVDLLEHEQASLAMAQRCSAVGGTAPLFAAVLNYRHSFTASDITWPEARGVKVVKTWTGSNYPIMVSVDDLGDSFAVSAQTRTVDPSRLIGYLRTGLYSLVEALEGSPQASALALAILPEAERQHVIEALNATRRVYPGSELIHELVEGQASQTPDAIALTHGGRSLTYAELNAAANRLARILREKAIGPDRLVGICLERSLEMVVGVLATLKAGGAYLPLDPNYPAERLAYMLEDARPLVVLTAEGVREALPPTSAETILLSSVQGQLAGAGTENLSAAETGLTPSNLLYVIYTSGSTGKPKGTAMPHRSMANLIGWQRQVLPAGRDHRVLQFAALSFDVAFQEIFSTLCTGGTLVLLDESVRKDARALLKLLREERVQRLFVPPLMLQSLAEFCTDGDVPAALLDVITAGEQLRVSPEIIALFKRLKGCRLHNHYGPTETHVVTALTLASDPQTWPALPTIGQPIANTRIYILNAQRQPVPFGVAGEIYIGGANVARGYLNRPELTAERFVRDQFGADATMYKTGDLGRWHADGTIEYLGRNDDQVKIRGFRIELGEIEARLAKHERVREAAVIARPDASGGKSLIAYVTSRGPLAPAVAELRSHLKATLPDHMVPTAILVLDRLPLTPSGKLNRRALPAPDAAAFESEHYEAPQGESERKLAAVWQNLLAVERVGRDDNFFDLGGHSLLVLKLVGTIERSFDRSVTVPEVYNGPTLRELAARLSGSTAEQEFVDQFKEAQLEDSIVAPTVRHAILRQAILLTGATGFVGRFILAQLLRDTQATVYCLLPASSAAGAAADVQANLVDWDLWRAEFEDRIVGVAGDPRQSRLGLEEGVYEELSRKVDTIYHSEATMNILATYALAKPVNVDPIRELLKFAACGRSKLINHVSTVGVFSQAIKDPIRVISEDTPIDNERYVTSRGYVASRWVAEKMLLNARDRGIPSNIFRVGLIWADAQLGRYDEQLFGYAILKSCLLSGFGIRNYEYPMPPTPVDYVARAITFLGNRRENGIYHISASRHDLDRVFERSGAITGLPLELSSYYEWIRNIQRLHAAGRSMPMVPLVQFAFTLDEAAFNEYHRNFLSAVNCRFDLSRTHRELEAAGIAAPVVDADMLRACIESMLSRDADLSVMGQECVQGVHEAERRVTVSLVN